MELLLLLLTLKCPAKDRSKIAYCLANDEFHLMKTLLLLDLDERERERKIVKTCYKCSQITKTKKPEMTNFSLQVNCQIQWQNKTATHHHQLSCQSNQSLGRQHLSKSIKNWDTIWPGVGPPLVERDIIIRIYKSFVAPCYMTGQDKNPRLCWSEVTQLIFFQ